MIPRILLVAAAGFSAVVASALPEQGLGAAVNGLQARHEGHHDDEESSPIAMDEHPGPMDMSQKQDNQSAEASSPHQDHSVVGHTGPAHSHGAPKEHFDPSSIPPDPLSYLVLDTTTDQGHGFLMGSHIVLMTLSWMGFLPLCMSFSFFHMQSFTCLLKSPLMP